MYKGVSLLVTNISIQILRQITDVTLYNKLRCGARIRDN